MEQTPTVRIGEIVLSPTFKLIGLGSCVGVILACQRTGHVAAAHVFLPSDEGRSDSRPKPGTYANAAIPALIQRLEAVGVHHGSLVAVICGGAQMFAHSQTSSVGARNIEAVTSALDAAGIQIIARDVGGNQGLSVHVENTDHIAVSSWRTGNPKRLLVAISKGGARSAA